MHTCCLTTVLWSASYRPFQPPPRIMIEYDVNADHRTCSQFTGEKLSNILLIMMNDNIYNEVFIFSVYLFFIVIFCRLIISPSNIIIVGIFVSENAFRRLRYVPYPPPASLIQKPPDDATSPVSFPLHLPPPNPSLYHSASVALGQQPPLFQILMSAEKCLVSSHGY